MPSIRDNRLRGDAERLAAIDQSSELIDIRALSGNPPDRYQVVYSCRGIAKLERGAPVYSKRHELELVLPAGYPLSMPQLIFKSPIFHPNFHASDGRVCIDQWFAAANLSDVVLMVGNMVRYANFNPQSPLNREAAIWASANRSLFPTDVQPWFRGDGHLTDLIEIDPARASGDLVIELG
ncbi:MAG: ubiquitin-conjugating enzyme E2 [Dehalococcoidia bacterium]